jgi:hypothetical protein
MDKSSSEPFNYNAKNSKKMMKKRKIETCVDDALMYSDPEQEEVPMAEHDDDTNTTSQCVRYIGVHTFDEVNGFFDLVDADSIIISLSFNEIFCFKGTCCHLY